MSKNFVLQIIKLINYYFIGLYVLFIKIIRIPLLNFYLFTLAYFIIFVIDRAKILNCQIM